MKKVTQTILVGKEAYLFLNGISREQRGCKPLSEEQKDRMWNRRQRDHYFKNGKYMLEDGSFGGGDGTYYGKWWEWDIATMKKMLDEAGIAYQDGDILEYEYELI